MQQCRADGLIDPDGIPGTNIKPDAVETAGTAFSTAAGDVAKRGAAVKTAWSGLGASYETPDAAQLLAVMDGVETDTATLAATMQKASTIIGDYATAVQPIQKALAGLKTEAEAFVAKALEGKRVGPGDPDHPAFKGALWEMLAHADETLSWVHIPWDQYRPWVARNNELLEQVAAQETKLSSVSAECVNAINGLRTDMCLPEVHGVDYSAAVDAGQAMPWGATGQGDQTCGERINGGVTEAARTAADGLGGLIGYNAQTGKWGDAAWAGESWKGFAESLGLIVLMGSPAVAVAAALPKGVLPDGVGETARNIQGKQEQLLEGFIGSPEDWRDDPAHATGAAIFNIGTLFIPGVGEVGAGAKIASLSAKVATIGADGSKLAAVTAKVAAAGAVVVRVGDELAALRAGLRGAVDQASAGVRAELAHALRQLGDRIPSIRVRVEHAMTPDGLGVGLGRPHIEVGDPGSGGHWVHSIADRVDGGGGDRPATSGAPHSDSPGDAAGEPPPRDPDFARAADDQPQIGHVEIQTDSATATWEYRSRNGPGMAEQQYFTGVHQGPGKDVPELIIRSPGFPDVAIDGHRMESGRNVFIESKGDHSFWYDFKQWSAEKLRWKDDTAVQTAVKQISRQVDAIARLGGGRLEYVVTDPRFAQLIEERLQRLSVPDGVDLELFVRSLP